MMSAFRESGKLFFILLLLIVACAPVFGLNGEIVYIDGFAWIDRQGREIDADFGVEIREGDIIETDIDSMVIIDLPGQAEVKLRENTIFKFTQLGNEISLGLEQGSAFSNVVKGAVGKYSIRTPSVVAGVRGTEFFISYGRQIDERPDIWLCVNEGSVEVAVPETGEAVTVNEGEGINILGGLRLTSPKPYKWTEDLNWNMDPDSGDVADTTDLDSTYADLLDADYD